MNHFLRQQWLIVWNQVDRWYQMVSTTPVLFSGKPSGQQRKILKMCVFFLNAFFPSLTRAVFFSLIHRAKNSALQHPAAPWVRSQSDAWCSCNTRWRRNPFAVGRGIIILKGIIVLEGHHYVNNESNLKSVYYDGIYLYIYI